MKNAGKRTRKVTSNGWWYRMAHHKERGLVLLDEFDQEALQEGQIRAYVLSAKETEIFAREEFRASLSGDVSDADFAWLMTSYNGFKSRHGRPIKVPPEEAHVAFLASRGLAPQTLRKTTRERNHRITHCWSCASRLDNAIDLECSGCKWIICACGACGCGWTGET